MDDNVHYLVYSERELSQLSQQPSSAEKEILVSLQLQKVHFELIEYIAMTYTLLILYFNDIYFRIIENKSSY